MIQAFAFNSNPGRVVFGQGTVASVGDEVRRANCSRAFVLSTGEQMAVAERVAQALGGMAAGHFGGAVMHTPVEVTERALAQARACNADCIVSIGGGSTTGLGKAIALRTDLPQIVVPTTYAGSEMTPILGETRDGIKTTQRSLKVLPETVIYDADLTLSLPAKLSVTSGINAIAHAVEALYARDGNPVVSLMAEESIAALARSLPLIVKNPADRNARSDALYGAWLAGTCLGLVGMALHHKLCHVLGGAFNLPHAERHTVVLPYALAFNAPAAPEAAARVAKALSVRDPATGLHDLAAGLGAPTSLRTIGMPADGIERACDLAVRDPYWNPRPFGRDDIRNLLQQAFAGEKPASR